MGWTDLMISLKGQTGPTGPQGVQGEQGPSGEQGPRGYDGPTGPRGTQGIQGVSGPQGPRGFDGPTGPQGTKGDQGIQGEQGPRGFEGPTGPQGPAGPQGVSGPQGSIGPTGPQGTQGIQGVIGPIGYTGPTGPAGVNYTGPTGSILYYDGTQVTGSTGLTYIYTETAGTGGMLISGDILPSQSNVFSLGSTGARWAEVYMGPGTLNIAGPSGGVATLGSNDAGIAYTAKGFATPFITVGPSIADPLDVGAIGGWKIGPTGTIGTDSYDLVAVHSDATGTVYGPTGGVSLIHRLNPANFTGTTGGTVLGSTGPTGATLVGSTTITISATGCIWAIASLGFVNSSTSSEHNVSIYITIDGYTSNTSTITVSKNNVTGGRANVTLHHLAGPMAPAAHIPVHVYAWDGAGGSITTTHCDIMAINNLALSP